MASPWPGSDRRPLLLSLRALLVGVSLVPVVRPAAQELNPPIPARNVCVVDSLAPNQLRLDSIVQYRIQRADSVITRDGDRVELWQVQPQVVGYAAPAEGVPTDTTTSHAPDRQVHWIRILDVRFTLFGRDSIIPHGRLGRIGEIHGISVFSTLGRDVTSRPLHLYVLVEPHCLWRPYMSELRRRTR